MCGIDTRELKVPSLPFGKSKYIPKEQSARNSPRCQDQFPGHDFLGERRRNRKRAGWSGLINPMVERNPGDWRQRRSAYIIHTEIPRDWKRKVEENNGRRGKREPYFAFPLDVARASWLRIKYLQGRTMADGSFSGVDGVTARWIAPAENTERWKGPEIGAWFLEKTLGS